MKLVCFDCDSTLSSVEGIDELGRLRGPEVFAAVERLTTDAMEGRIRIEDIFKLRLDVIRPTRADAAMVGARYLANVEPSALATVRAIEERGWTPLIISGGFRPAIRPLADFLGIARVEAVELHFAADGSYAGFDEAYPSTRSGGKPEIIATLRQELAPERIVMVGDGASDLETQPFVDLFVGFGRYVARAKVKQEARAFITALSQLPGLLPI